MKQDGPAEDAMDAIGHEGEGEEEDTLEEDLLVDPTAFSSMAAPTVGTGSLVGAVQPKKKAPRAKRSQEDDDDDIYQTEVASSRPDWMAKDERMSKVADSLGKVYKCMFGLNPVENLTNRKPVGHQLTGVGGFQTIWF